MEIHQALGTSRPKDAETNRYLGDLVEELKASGFIADALARSGRRDASVAPPAE